MQKIDIDWLHKENKTGRCSGRTTEMLANVVGIAQLSYIDSHVMVVSSNAHDSYMSFIEVLRAIDPCATYTRTIVRGYPSVIVRSDFGAPCYVMFSERNFHHWANGVRNAYQVVDHYFLEKKDEAMMFVEESRKNNRRRSFY